MNAFSGTLPAIIGSSWTQMVTFSVNENMLSGTIPSSVGIWSKARIFWIADNLINGTLPDTIGEWKALESFDVRFSWLWRVCRDAFNSAHRWVFFQASRNFFTGTLPPSIGQWTDLAEFYIIGCQSLTGSIPQGTAQWQNLQVAYFNDTALVGSIPDELCGVVNLTDLSADCMSEVACSCCTACY